ncbi:MAG: hypothetical protein M9962_09195 [Oligoflexia bacterium]|nr:hypothetical protein [Oligoflexia bacterium]
MLYGRIFSFLLIYIGWITICLADDNSNVVYTPPYLNPTIGDFYKTFNNPVLNQPTNPTNEHIQEQISEAKEIMLEAIKENPQILKELNKPNAEDVEIPIPKEKRALLASLLEKIDPKKASRLKETGKIGARTLSSMMIFYLAMGASETWKCFKKNDPTACRAFIKSMKDPAGHVGFLLFMAAARGTTYGLQKAGGGKISPRIATYLGTAAGFMVNDLFLEFYNNEHVKKYFASFNDESTSEETRSEILHDLFQETFGNAEWYKEKAPLVISLLAATAASELTMKGIDLGRNKIMEKYIPADPNKRNYCQKSFAQLALIQSGEWGSKITGKWKNRLYHAGVEAAGILLFLQWMDILDPITQKTWNTMTSDVDLIKSMQKNTKKMNLEELQAHLNEVSTSWDQYRRKQLHSVESTMYLHSSELYEIDSESKKANLFYSYILAERPEIQESVGDQIIDRYFNNKTNTAKEDFIKVKNKYLVEMFCGVDIQDSIDEAKEIRGIPNPIQLSTKFSPYRLTKEKPSFCREKNALSEAQKQLNNREIVMQLDSSRLKTQDIAITLASQIKDAKINRYEDIIDKKILSIINSTKIRGNNLPVGLEKSYEQEEAYYKKILAETKDKELIIILNAKLTSLEKKKGFTKELKEYFSMPLSKRKKVAQDLDEETMFSFLFSTPDWLEAYQYISGYNLRKWYR